MSLRPAADFHQKLFGVTLASEVEVEIQSFCAEHLGPQSAHINFYWVSTGAVAGVELDDGRHLACKFLPRGLETVRVLRACRRVQANAVACGLPAPTPVLDPIEWRAATVTVDSWLPSPPPLDATQPPIRRGLAGLLHALIEVSRELREPDLLQSRYQLPATPPTCGLTEFDAVAAASHHVLRTTTAQRAIGHIDWRSQNVHVDETGQPIAIYDWDAVTVDSEEFFVGTAAAMLSVVFAAPNSSLPSPGDVAEFVAEYELARASTFGRDQRDVIAAAVLYKLGRHAIIETDLDPNEAHIDDRSIRRALRRYGPEKYRSELLKA